MAAKTSDGDETGQTVPDDPVRLVMDDIPALVSVTLPDGSLHSVNRRWLEYYSLSLDEARGWGWNAVMHPNDLPRVMRDWRAAVASGEPLEIESRVQRADGEYRWFLHRSVPVRDDAGNIVRWYSVSTDIEDRKRVEEDLQESEERYRTLARQLLDVQESERHAVARELHDDLGQTLTAIKLALAGRSGSRRRADDIGTGLALVDEAIERVRNLAIELRPLILDELGLVAALRWLVGRKAREAKVDVHLDVAAVETKRLPAALETACFRLVQEAFTNILRHSAARRVEVAVNRGGDRVSVIVRDDGKGFDKEAARKRAAVGGSLGVISMEERVALAGGRLSIESGPGRGTTVRAEFPLKAGE
ncbi:MAG TPA: PAS domain-containing protein [Candidatus Binatus sp.]|nr:PAS domain-containing protein [Candidatus Binatus sp.]